MENAKLSWFPDRGFVLETETAKPPISLKFMEMPLPADGTAELREGVALDRLDLMFKAQVELQGEPGLLLGCTVTLVDQDAGTAVTLSGEIEDTETGDVTALEATLKVQVPSEAPKSGGPRPPKMDEDELDWQDETTLDEIVLPTPPKRAPAAEKAGKEPGTRGLERLLAALASMDDDDEPEASSEAPPEPAPRPPPPPADPDDQSMGADDEARGFLELLIRGDSLELEEGAELDGLMEGTKRILQGRGTPEAKATQLSGWLLDQDSVADLYIGDEELASLLAQW
ncbi:MAG: hypothetical protein AAGA48_40395 [Myxococcota bacterium]